MSSYLVPNVITTSARGERIMDVYSHLLNERIVYLGTAIDDGVANAVVANWGVSPANLLDVLSGASPARGTLPFDVPRSTAAVEASRSDVPFDTADPLFRFGHGLSL